ncbi:MAG: hypothetical protein AAFR93_06120 [Pseudomonadota bacterium]
MRTTLLPLAAALSVCATFVALEHAHAHRAPDEGGPRRLEVVGTEARLVHSPSARAEPLARPTPGDVFANEGCASFDSVLWCRVKALGKGPRGHIEAQHLRPAQGPDGHVPTGLDTSRARARTGDFDARGEILCAQEQGQSLGRCKAAVARARGGDATVVVTFPNGFARQLYFTHGRFMRGSATMSGVGTDIDWSLEAGIYVVRVDDQAFEIPVDFVLGR